MTWSKAAIAILISPVLVGVVVFYALMVAWKLPEICCGRWRCARYLSLAGVIYYGIVLPSLVYLYGFVWWETLLFPALAAVSSAWLLPDPVTFIFNPHKRRVVVRAIEYIEVNNEVLYGMVSIAAVKPGQMIVSVPIRGSIRPPARRLVSVADDGQTAAELGIEYMVENHGLKYWR